MVKRTKKHFIPYNEYEDRRFGMKWATAFAMEELSQGIKDNYDQAMQVNQVLPQMSRQDIDACLQEAFTRHQAIAIQLNHRDAYGHIENEVVGYFTGQANEQALYFKGQWLAWSEIRHIRLLKEKKWSDLEE